MLVSLMMQQTVNKVQTKTGTSEYPTLLLKPYEN